MKKERYNLGDKVKTKEGDFIIILPFYGEDVFLPSEENFKSPKQYTALSFIKVGGRNCCFTRDAGLYIIKTKDITSLIEE
jgi:hypothetical protein